MTPIIDAEPRSGASIEIKAFNNKNQLAGQVQLANANHAQQAIASALHVREACNQVSAQARADALEQTACELIENLSTLQSLCTIELGIHKQTSEGDIQQAATLCRAYAKQCLKEFSQPTILQGPTGEHNEYRLHNRGIFLCIGATQQPITALSAMMAANLAAGNPVILLPDENLFLAAASVFSCFIDSGFTKGSLHYLPIQDKTVKEQLLNDRHLAGVSALCDPKSLYELEKTLARRPGPNIPLIASIKHQKEGGLFANPMNLYRFATARSISINTTASGGNASLYCMDEDD